MANTCTCFPLCTVHVNKLNAACLHIINTSKDISVILVKISVVVNTWVYGSHVIDPITMPEVRSKTITNKRHLGCRIYSARHGSR